MIDSSFIISPVSADFSDVWSEPELLSAKGHNAIYVAKRFGRRYILKALAEQYRESTPYIEMLRKEFSIGVGLDHPNIVRLLDFGHMDSIGWYIQMEYIDGITLEQFLATIPSMATRCRIMHQLLETLSYLHERQIIHRDIKPSNILITRNGSTVKLIDFGVSDTDDYVTFKQPAGSMAYIAPEQLAGKTIDNRADIYAFGRIIELVFPHRYHLIAHRCTRETVSKRYSSCSRVARAIRNADRLRTWLPVSFLLLILACVGVRGSYTNYRHSLQLEQIHSAHEQSLSAQIDSLNTINGMLQSIVDSLNLQHAIYKDKVDSLIFQIKAPSPKELLKAEAQQMYADYIRATRKAIENEDVAALLSNHPTPSDSFWKRREELLDSIQDDELKSEFDSHLRSYHIKMYQPFMKEIAQKRSELLPSPKDWKTMGIDMGYGIW